MKKVISILLTVLMVAVCIPFAETNASTNQNPTFVMKKENWGLQKWGELSFADNAVTASFHYQSLYTTVDGFEPNTKYSLSFNVSAGDKITRTWVIEPGEDLSKAECWVNANSGTYNGTKTDLTVPGTFFTKDYSTKDKTTGKYKEGGLGSAYFEFTTTNSTSYTFIINIGACTDTTVGNNEPTTLSDFSIRKNPNGIFAIKNWTSGTTWGSFYTDAVYADSIKLMGNQWRSQYCDLGVLEANTTYTLTYKFAHGTKDVFQSDSNKNYSCGIINAPKAEIDAWFQANSSALNYEKTGFKNYVNEIGAVHKRTDTDETFTFTTDESKHYYLVVSLQEYSAEYPAGANYITLYEPSLIKVGHAFTPKTGTNLNGQSPAASLRPESGTKPAGIRIKSTILKQSVAANKVVEYGYLVTKADYLKEADTEHAKDSSFVVGGAVAMPANCPAKVYENNTAIYDITADELSYEFGCVLIGIQPKDYATVYSVRAYSKDSQGNYYYGDVVDVCMYDVVYAIDSTEGAADTDVDAAKAVVARATSGTGVMSYAAWLTSKGYESNNLK